MHMFFYGFLCAYVLSAIVVGLLLWRSFDRGLA
jgi:hypothetical protein